VTTNRVRRSKGGFREGVVERFADPSRLNDVNALTYEPQKEALVYQSQSNSAPVGDHEALGHDLGMNSRVHPKYKTKYRVNNWAEYDRTLVQPGDITLWISEDAITSWKPTPSGLRGGQKKFSDCAIETAPTLRLVFNLPLRQAEGFMGNRKNKQRFLHHR